MVILGIYGMDSYVFCHFPHLWKLASISMSDKRHLSLRAIQTLNLSSFNDKLYDFGLWLYLNGGFICLSSTFLQFKLGRQRLHPRTVWESSAIMDAMGQEHTWVQNS